MLYSLLTILLACKNLVGIRKKTVFASLTRNKSGFYKDFLQIQYNILSRRQIVIALLPSCRQSSSGRDFQRYSNHTQALRGGSSSLTLGRETPRHMQTANKTSSPASTGASPNKQVSPVISPLRLVFSAVKWG